MAVYAAGFFLMFGFSFAYNMTPASPVKWILRRCDHSAIYLMIAGTYTALLSQIPDSLWAAALVAFVWSGALVGVALRAVPARPLRPRRDRRLSRARLVGDRRRSSRSSPRCRPQTLALVVVGGVIYSIGVVFHLWHSLKFQNAIWHACVAVAAACHFAGILQALG